MDEEIATFSETGPFREGEPLTGTGTFRGSETAGGIGALGDGEAAGGIGPLSETGPLPQSEPLTGAGTPGESETAGGIGPFSETGPLNLGGTLSGTGTSGDSGSAGGIRTGGESGIGTLSEGGPISGAGPRAAAHERAATISGDGEGDFSAAWLALREPADAAARAAELIGELPGPVRTVRDLGCGTGSLGRWLSPRLPLPQHWIMTDRDPALLLRAAGDMPEGVTVSTQRRDVTELTAADLAGTDLVTCSALLDLLTAAEVERLAAVCAEARVAALFTLSVTGEVRLAPDDPLDAEIEAAFNEHQRRAEGGRRLLGPDAPEVAVAAFEKAGARVIVRPSPWRLGPALPALTAEWLRGWVAAALEERPDLAVGDYVERRLASLPHASVGHQDVLAIFS
ncbi:class I SAM-dependent methyltransferase [Actinoplanes hulinensis]|uniref:Class I SAM-dependent methyltransferase n=1 Tax=Actinoplanes hulinensis TaxID=1144547 RepID=A0ABS7B176_9ACTN|nr:class I SAM-dependent methyltransferase [Actinoplanes hulinensis]